MNNDLIEQIVANVLAELQPASPMRAPVSKPPAVSLPDPPRSAATTVDLDVAVITADLLSERVRAGQAIRISRRSILTPSARDWLAQRKVNWSRASGATSNQTSTRWQLILTTITPAVSTLKPSLTGWKTELLGTPQEAADGAVRVISTAEVDGVLVICQSAASVACQANRNQKVRAAVLNTTAEVPSLVSELNPNLLVINPVKKSFVELRNLVQAVLK